MTLEGWESSTSLEDFTAKRVFNPSHKYRRRRWFRPRTGSSADSIVQGVNAFFQPALYSQQNRQQGEEKETKESCISVALQVGGGKWALTSMLPRHGKVYGALRAARSRWPQAALSTKEKKMRDFSVLELCYSVSPLDGIWGDISRVMVVSSRFLLRNHSTSLTLEVKQTGAEDSSAVRVSPEETVPFHWADFRLPELISVRPVEGSDAPSIYRWSGGFDPLTIGVTPLRIRPKDGNNSFGFDETANKYAHVRTLQVETEIRTRTGGTGINLTFQDEDESGAGALFRIENRSCFPIWFSQDGLLANNSSKSDAEKEGDLVWPSESTAFGLDVPFRQGKYSHRRAATLNELLMVRLSLAPLSTRAGIETTKVISLTTAGEVVRLNPSKLMFLSSDLRVLLRKVRVLGLIVNDGPTRVLRFW